jgi:hypothetical protein
VPLLPLVVLALAGSPSPSPSVKEPDPDTVSPGWWGFLSLVFLAVTVYLIWRGLTKQLKRVDFDENAPQTIARGPREPAATSTPVAATSDSPAGGTSESPLPEGDAPLSGAAGHASPTEADGDEPARSE